MADDRQNKLDLTISSVTPARLEQTRQEVGVEVQKLTNSGKPPAEPVPPSEEEPSPVSEAVERLKKLDLIQDVQLILVDKYRTGTKIMWIAVALMVVSLAGMGRLLYKNNDLYNHIEALQTEQTKLIERGAQIERKTDETSAKVDETKAKVDETNAKVDQAVESAPKIEIDDAGKAKVVLPVKTSEPVSFKRPPHPPSSASASVKEPPIVRQTLPVPSQLPVEQRKF